MVSYNAVVAAGGPTQPHETSGGTNLSELDDSPPSAPATDQSGTGLSVDAATGELDDNVTDAAIPGPGEPLDLTRTYSSTQAATEGPLGYGWVDSYDMSVAPDPTLGSTVMDVAQEH